LSEDVKISPVKHIEVEGSESAHSLSMKAAQAEKEVAKAQEQPFSIP
jgi:hypothetical protein